MHSTLFTSAGDTESQERPRSATSMRRNHGGRGKEVGMIGQAGWLGSVINLVNTIVGAGVLAMPRAMSHMGVVLGVSVILLSGLTAGFGLYLQTRCARYLERGSASFFALSQITYPNVAVLFDAAIAVKCFGVGVSYLIIIGNLMPGVARGFDERADQLPFLVDRHFWVTAFMLVVIPFSFLRRLDSLKYTSVVALISIGYLIVLVVAHYAMGDTLKDRGPVQVIEWAGVVPTLSSFPVIVFAFTCHQNMFSVLNEIGNNSHFRTTAVVVASIGSAAFIYILVAITGYFSFGDKVSDNIIEMYIPSVASTIGKAAIVVFVMFSYPLQVHPCRASVDAVLRWRPKRFSDSSSSSSSSPSRATLLGKASTRDAGMSEMRFAAITTVVLVLSYMVAMTVSSLEAVLAYVGSTGSTSISFILPGLFYYKISAPDSPLHQRLMKEDDDSADQTGSSRRAGGDEGEDEGLLGTGLVARFGWRKEWLRPLALALAIYGFVVMVTCLVTNTFFIVAH